MALTFISGHQLSQPLIHIKEMAPAKAVWLEWSPPLLQPQEPMVELSRIVTRADTGLWLATAKGGLEPARPGLLSDPAVKGEQKVPVSSPAAEKRRAKGPCTLCCAGE